ncbi:unnamed protein product, partial [Allacma fusca]
AVILLILGIYWDNAGTGVNDSGNTVRGGRKT